MDKEVIEREFVNISINSTLKSVKIDVNQENIEQSEHGCDAKDEIPSSKAVANKKGSNKLICYKCKKNNSNFFNKSEYVCK